VVRYPRRRLDRDRADRWLFHCLVRQVLGGYQNGEFLADPQRVSPGISDGVGPGAITRDVIARSCRHRR
jgi:hypothetical protein